MPGPLPAFGRVALLAALALAAPGPADAADDSAHALLQRLRAGGLVVFLRHTHTGTGIDVIRYNVDPRALEDCSTQRDLDALGESQAVAIGNAVRSLGIHFSDVRASPYCRTRKTAAGALPDVEVVLDESLATICQASGRDFDRRTTALRALLGSPPVAGNRLLVSHNCNIRALSRSLSRECARRPRVGDAVVFEPLGDGFRELGCIPLAAFEAHSR